jgi:hypothetical protein
MERVVHDAPTSRPVAETPAREDDRIRHNTTPEQDLIPTQDADLPKGVNKPDAELESVTDDLRRVEKRTTM